MIGQEVIRRFDAEQIEPQEIDYGGNGEKAQKFDYTVTDPNTDEVELFRASTTASGDIDALLAEGYSLLKMRRKGTGFGTKYFSHQLRKPEVQIIFLYRIWLVQYAKRY